MSEKLTAESQIKLYPALGGMVSQQRKLSILGRCIFPLQIVPWKLTEAKDVRNNLGTSSVFILIILINISQ